MRKRFILLIISVAVALSVSEFAVRKLGYQPAMVEDISDSIKGHGLVLDPVLGFSLNPGDVYVDFINQLKNHAHHCEDKSRATSPVCTKPNDTSFSSSIYMYGCSFTYGSNLDDSMTMAWKIKAMMPERNVKNFGVGGFGLSQMYLQVLEHVKDSIIPDIVIINYASMHDMRTVFSRTWRKIIVPSYKANVKNEERLKMVPIDSINWPYYRLDANQNPELKYVRLTKSYTEWPFVKQLALMNLFEKTYNKYADEKLQSAEVTFKLFQQLNDLCNKHHIRLLVAGLLADEQTKQMLQRCKGLGITTYQYQVDLGNPKYTLEPLDTHPNSLGNTLMAQEMVELLKSKGW